MNNVFRTKNIHFRSNKNTFPIRAENTFYPLFKKTGMPLNFSSDKKYGFDILNLKLHDQLKIIYSSLQTR